MNGFIMNMSNANVVCFE